MEQIKLFIYDKTTIANEKLKSLYFKNGDVFNEEKAKDIVLGVFIVVQGVEVGYVLLSNSAIGILVDIFVDSDHTRNGYAKAALLGLLKHASNNGFYQFTALIQENNKAGQGLAIDCGFIKDYDDLDHEGNFSKYTKDVRVPVLARKLQQD